MHDFNSRETLKTVKKVFNLTDFELSSKMGIELPRLRRHFKQNTTFSAYPYLKLADELKISFDNLISGNISVTTKEIPDKYKNAPNSKIRTINNLLNHARNLMGEDIVKYTLRHLHMNEQLLENDEAPINILSCRDASEYLEKYCFKSKKDFYYAGINSTLAHKGTLLEKKMQGKKPRELYEEFANNISFIEQNNKYKITQLTDSICVLESKETEEVKDTLRLKTFSSNNVCHLRAGVMAGIPLYSGLPHADVIEDKCIYRGDSYCRFIIDFSRSSDFFNTYRRPH